MTKEIVEGIGSALLQEFGYESHTEPMGQEKLTPCFVISCVESSDQKYPGNRYLLKNAFKIRYFPKLEDNAEAEYYETAERMKNCLEFLQIEGHPIPAGEKKYEITDQGLSFFVNYNCFIYQAEEQNAMENMDSRTNVKG